VISTKREWPRTVLVVTQGPGNPVPQLLTLVQTTPRDNYKLAEAAPLLPGLTFPNADKAGASAVPLDGKQNLQASPTEALQGLGDRLTNPASAWKDKIADNPYISDTASYQADIVAKSPNGNFTFSHTVVPEHTVTFRTADGGALVVGDLTFTIDGTPKNPNDKLSVGDDAAVLTGGKETTTGMKLNFGESVVVYVPPADSKGKILLVAATRGLVSAAFK
jgi:hypothetical protein